VKREKNLKGIMGLEIKGQLSRCPFITLTAGGGASITTFFHGRILLKFYFEKDKIKKLKKAPKKNDVKTKVSISTMTLKARWFNIISYGNLPGPALIDVITEVSLQPRSL